MLIFPKKIKRGVYVRIKDCYNANDYYLHDTMHGIDTGECKNQERLLRTAVHECSDVPVNSLYVGVTEMVLKLLLTGIDLYVIYDFTKSFIRCKKMGRTDWFYLTGIITGILILVMEFIV